MLRASVRRAAPVTLPIAPKKPFLVYNNRPQPLPELKEEVTVESEQLVKFLKQMLGMRWMETQCHTLYQQKKIRGFCHLYIGQEAIAAGMESVLDWKDSVVTGYRDHCWHLTRGGTVEEVVAEQMGKVAGCSKGKGGSMHMYKTANNYYGGNGIVGAQVAIGAGLAWTYALQAQDGKPAHVAVALYGDGAANQGQIFESFNIASLQKAPAIFVCENNHFGMGTGEARASANPVFHRRCEYIPGIRVDGMNVLAVAEATRVAKEWCTAGNGPIILEMDSYRYKGHSMSDPDTAYRTRDDIRKVRDERDAVLHLKGLLQEHGIATKEEIDTWEKEIKAETMASIRKAAASGPPPAAELTTDIYDYTAPVRSTQGTVFV